MNSSSLPAPTPTGISVYSVHVRIHPGWKTIAKVTTHNFTVASVAVFRPPDEVTTVQGERILGRWSVTVPVVEGYAEYNNDDDDDDQPAECPLGKRLSWLLLVLLVFGCVLGIVYYMQRRQCQVETTDTVIIRLPLY